MRGESARARLERIRGEMPGVAGRTVRSLGWRTVPAAVLPLLLSVACSGLGLGGGLELNVTDTQTRAVHVQVTAASPDARLLEERDGEQTELGRGSVAVDRFVLQRVTFGRGLATGFFLCAVPCDSPLETFLVAVSPDGLFAPAGELRLRFRVERADGGAEELSRIVTPAMLEELWDEPLIEISARR